MHHKPPDGEKNELEKYEVKSALNKNISRKHIGHSPEVKAARRPRPYAGQHCCWLSHTAVEPRGTNHEPACQQPSWRVSPTSSSQWRCGKGSDVWFWNRGGYDENALAAGNRCCVKAGTVGKFAVLCVIIRNFFLSQSLKIWILNIKSFLPKVISILDRCSSSAGCVFSKQIYKNINSKKKFS